MWRDAEPETLSVRGACDAEVQELESGEHTERCDDERVNRQPEVAGTYRSSGQQNRCNEGHNREKRTGDPEKEQRSVDQHEPQDPSENPRPVLKGLKLLVTNAWEIVD